MIIRKIQPSDNPFLAEIIRSIFDEFDAPKTGTAYADPNLDMLFEVYQKPNSIYFVVEDKGEIFGGGGLAPLAMQNQVQPNDLIICELQKMYFAPEIRGKGFGKEIIEKCLDFAKENGFNYCYLETLPYMKAAQKLYLNVGFTYLNKPMGNTGHCNCDVWMGKEL